MHSKTFQHLLVNSGGKYSSIIDMELMTQAYQIFESGDNKLVRVDPNMKSDNLT